MADQGFVLYPDFDITKAEAKIRKLQREYDNAKKDIENKQIEMDITSENIEKTKNTIKTLKTELEELSKTNREKFLAGTLTKDDTAALKSKREEIEKQNQALTKQEALYKKQEFSLERQKTKTANIGDQIALNGKKQNKFSQAFQKSQKSADRFGKRLKSLIASALFFSVVTKAFTALRNEFGKLITETGTKTASLVAQLNGSLSVLGRTLYEGARPYIEWILQMLIKMVNILTNGLAKILGKNVNEMKKLARQTKKTGEEAKKATAGFDTLQTIDTSSNSNGAGTDFSALNDGIDNETALLMMLLSGAALVLGVILTFTGANIPLGLGLIVAGAIGLASSIAASWDTMPQKTKDTITGIMGIGGALFIILGLCLILTGAGIPLGIGLILLGAGMLYGAYALTPGDSFLEKITNLWENCKEITKNFIRWFSENVLDGIFGKGLGDSLEGMFDSWCNMWEDIVAFFKADIKGDWKGMWKSFANIVIDLLNNIISSFNLLKNISTGWFFKIINKIGDELGWDLDLKVKNIPKIPRLATGAILPGGSPMLAWVNDQPKGQPYLEGSIDNIAAAFEKYLGGNGGKQNININFTGSLAQLARVLAPEISTENVRTSIFAKG